MKSYIKWLLGILFGALLTLLVFIIILPKPSQSTIMEPISKASPPPVKPTIEVITKPSSMPTKAEKEKADLLNTYSQEWTFFGNNLWQNRFSPDEKMNKDTIAGVTLVYDHELPANRGNETYPLVENGIMYVTTGRAQVIALDALSGKTLWSFTPKIRLTKGMSTTNRGVALGADKVYVLTPDNQLIAIRKTDGVQIYSVVVADVRQGYFETMAPLYADGRVFVGCSGGDAGVRGFVSAYDAEKGGKLWQFYTVPERGTDWMPLDGDHGGGAVWTTPAYDPESKRLYFGTGNPSPDFFGESRKGDNLYTDSVVSIDVVSGKMVWYQQEVSHDLWDYDVASPPMLFNVGSKLIVGEAGKNGFWYEWDAETGAPFTEPIAFVKQDHQPPTEEGTMVWPGPAGGANYGPSAYSPLTKQVYIAGINGPATIYSKKTEHHEGENDYGTGQEGVPVGEWSGTITAVDPSTGLQNWQINIATPAFGGVTVNAGNLVVFGQSNETGTLSAVSAESGKLLWSTETGGPIGSAPIIYQINGQSYLTVVTGGAIAMLGLYPYFGQAHVLTYKID